MRGFSWQQVQKELSSRLSLVLEKNEISTQSNSGYILVVTHDVDVAPDEPTFDDIFGDKPKLSQSNDFFGGYSYDNPLVEPTLSLRLPETIATFSNLNPDS